MSSYRNVRFGFSGTASRVYFIVFLLPILILVAGVAVVYGGMQILPDVLSGIVVFAAIIGAYALYPIFHQLLAHYSHNFHRYGTAMFAAPLKKRAFCWIYLKAFIPFVLLFAALGGLAYVVKNNMGIDMESVFEDPESLEAMMDSPLASAAMVAVYAALFLIGSVITAYWRSMIRNYRYKLTTVGDRVKLHSTVKALPLAWLSISNFLLLIISVGFAYPWVKVRNARYFARNTSVSSNGPLDQFAADEQDKVTSIGAELGDAFDLDLDIGI